VRNPALPTRISKEAEFANTPKIQYSISSIYRYPASWGEASFRLDYSWQDRIYFSDLNTPILSQDAYGLLNERITLAFNSPFEFAFFGRNLTDKEYASFGAGAGAFNFIKPGEPRLFGVEARYRFE